MNSPPPCARNPADGDYFFCVDGLPTYYTWGMLKDLARKAAPYPGWTEMASNTHGMLKGRGWIRIRRPKDAQNLYGFFTSGASFSKPLKVYLWSTAKSPPELLQCNSEFPRQRQTFLQQTADIPASRQSHSGLAQHPSHLQRRNNTNTTTNPTYIYTQDNKPINPTTGLLKTQSRGIFISQLDFNIDQAQLESHLRLITDFEKCELRRDGTTGRSRGIATAIYKTAEAAATAVQMFHGRKLGGKRVNVRFDVEMDVVGCVAVDVSVGKEWRDGPIIANGSVMT